MTKKEKNCPIKKLFKKLNLYKHKEIIRPIVLWIIIVTIWIFAYFKYFQTTNIIRNFVPKEATQLVYVDTTNDFIQKILSNQQKATNDTWFQTIIKSLDEVILWQIINSGSQNSPTFVIAKLSKTANLDKLQTIIKKYKSDWFKVQPLSDSFFVYWSPNTVSMIANMWKENFLNTNKELQDYIPTKNIKKSVFFTVKITDQLQKLVKTTYPIQWINFVVADADVNENWGNASVHILFDKPLKQAIWLWTWYYTFTPKFLPMFGKNSLLWIEFGPIANKFMWNKENIQMLIQQWLQNNENFQLLSTQDYQNLAWILSDNFFVWAYNSEKWQLPVWLRLIFANNITETWWKMIKWIKDTIKKTYPNMFITDINQNKQQWFVLNIPQWTWTKSLDIPVIMTSTNDNSMLSIGYPQTTTWELEINSSKNTIFTFSSNIEKVYELYQNYMSILWSFWTNMVIPPFPENLKWKTLKWWLNINDKSIEINLEMK